MPNTNSKQAIGAVIKDNEAEAIYNTAITAVNGLHAVANMVIDARKDCQSVNDFEMALRKVTDDINVTMGEVDMCLGIGSKPPPDTTDLSNDDLAIEIISPSRDNQAA